MKLEQEPQLADVRRILSEGDKEAVLSLFAYYDTLFNCYGDVADFYVNIVNELIEYALNVDDAELKDEAFDVLRSSTFKVDFNLVNLGSLIDNLEQLQCNHLQIALDLIGYTHDLRHLPLLDKYKQHNDKHVADNANEAIQEMVLGSQMMFAPVSFQPLKSAYESFQAGDLIKAKAAASPHLKGIAHLAEVNYLLAFINQEQGLQFGYQRHIEAAEAACKGLEEEIFFKAKVSFFIGHLTEAKRLFEKAPGLYGCTDKMCSCFRCEEIRKYLDELNNRLQQASAGSPHSR